MTIIGRIGMRLAMSSLFTTALTIVGTAVITAGVIIGTAGTTMIGTSADIATGTTIATKKGER